MKKLTLLAGLLLAFFLAYQPVASAAQVTELNAIVAVVDDDVITRAELDARLDQLKQQLAQNNAQLPPQSVLERQMLERLIIEKLELQQADSMGLKLSDDSLNKLIQNIARDNKLTLSQMHEVLARDGVDYATFRENIRREYTINQVKQRMVDNKIVVTDQEIEAYLRQNASSANRDEEYDISHILVAVPDGASPDQIEKARLKAQDILSRLRAGADFRNTAISDSDGRQALEGGELGWRKAGELPTLFSEVVPGMQPGDLSDILRSASGFHIIRLNDRRGGERHIIQQTHARHILIRTNEIVSDFDAKQRLERLRERILAGEDFATLAKANSEDPGSGAKGGDLGWANPGSFVPEFEQVMNKLAPNAISQPFQSPFGWHIIQLLGRRDYDNTDEYNKAQARNLIKQRKASEEENLWLRRLRDEAFVEVRLGN